MMLAISQVRQLMLMGECILDSSLLIIGAGIEQIYAYELGRKLGYKVIGTDENPEAPAFRHADYKLIASTRSHIDTLDAVKNSKHCNSIKGVLTLANDVPYTVAYVANYLGLPSISLETASLSMDKFKMKCSFMKENVRTPTFKYCSSLEDLTTFIKQEGFPSIIKPIDGRGARGVVLIEESIDLKWAFKHCLSQSSSKAIIIEKFVPGRQISTEGFILNGKLYNCAYADRNYDKLQNFKPFILEDGGSLPAKLTNTIKKEIDSQLVRAALALKLENGTIKGDIVIDKQNKIYVIEVATRLSGGFFCTDQIPATTGVDLVLQTILLAVGLPIKKDALEPKHRCFSETRYWFPKKGKLSKIPKLEKIINEKNVLKADIFHGPNTHFDEISKHSDRLGFVIVTSQKGPNFARKQADDIINKYYPDFQFV